MDFTPKDTPIIESLMDVDFYKFPMGQLVFKKHRNTWVRFGLKNRTAGIFLANEIPIEQLREQLDHVRSLRFNNSELHYIRGTNEYQDRMFQEDYLDFLKGFQLPEYELEYRDNEMTLEFPGPWSTTSHHETLALSVINELYYRNQLKKMTRLERDAVMATGIKNLLEKIKKLREYPNLTFSDFGTRRRFSREWQKYVVEIIAAELPEQFKGTSNVKLAMDLGLMPTGTSAHEMDMGYSGIYHDSEEDILNSHHRFAQDWREMYGYGLSISLSDTYGTNFFFRDWPEDWAREDKGLRQDSGDPFKFGDRAIEHYKKLFIDARKKLIVFSDGLDVDKMILLHCYFYRRIMETYGWGTGLTNDLGFRVLSLVIKMIESNGHGTVKLSDNLNKAMGKPEDIEMFKRIFGYTNTASEDCRY